MVSIIHKLDWRVAWWALFAISAALRLIALDGPALWYDEAGSTWMASLPTDRMIVATAGDVHPPLSMLMLSPLVWAFGPQAWVVRLPSVLFGLAAIWLTRRIAERIGLSPSANLVASSLVALSPFQLYFSQEARMYALLQALVLAATLAALNGRYGWFVLWSTLALYTHNYGVIYLAVIGVVIIGRELMMPHTQSKFSILPITLASPLLLWSPWLVVVLTMQMRDYAADWIPPLTLAGWLQPFMEFIWPSSTTTQWLWPATTLLTFMIVLYAMCAVIIFSDRRAHFLAWMCIAPALLATAITLLWRPMYLWRPLIGIAPFLYLLIAWALANTPRRAWLTALAISPLMLIGVHTYYPNVERVKGSNDMPLLDVARAISSHWKEGDIIYHINVGSIMPMKFYAEDYQPVFLMPAEAGSLGVLRPVTRQAMGMVEVPLDQLQWRRAWLVWTAGPTVTEAEDREVAKMLSRYLHQQFIHWRSEYTVGGLWLLYQGVD